MLIQGFPPGLSSLFAVLLLCFVAPLLAEESRPARLPCGSIFLRRDRPVPAGCLKRFPSPGFRAATAPLPFNFKVGALRIFKVYNFNTGNLDYQEATCRIVGENCYLFIPETYFNSTTLGGNPTTVSNQLVQHFQATILPLVESWIGALPNPGIDGDPRIIILLTDIQDDFSRTGSYVGGFFYEGDQYPEVGGNQGNTMDIVYMDVHPGNPGSTDWYSVLAHELTHLVHHVRGGGGEDRWVQEGTSTLVDYLYQGASPQPQVRDFLTQPNISLVDNTVDEWFGDRAFAHYGAAMLFLTYLKNRFGGDQTAGQQSFLRALVAESKSGRAGVEAVTAASFNDLFRDWSNANVLDDPVANQGRWCYLEDFDSNPDNDLNLPTAPIRRHLAAPLGAGISGMIANWGNLYHEFSGQGTLNLEFRGAHPGQPYTVTTLAFPVDGPPVAANLELSASATATIRVEGLGSSLLKVILRLSLERELPTDMAQSSLQYSLVPGETSSASDVILVPLVNPAQPWLITLAAKHPVGFLEPPSVLLRHHDETRTLTFERVTDRVYITRFVLPRGFRGAYSALLTGRTSQGSRLERLVWFEHNF